MQNDEEVEGAEPTNEPLAPAQPTASAATESEPAAAQESVADSTSNILLACIGKQQVLCSQVLQLNMDLHKTNEQLWHANHQMGAIECDRSTLASRLQAATDELAELKGKLEEAHSWLKTIAVGACAAAATFVWGQDICSALLASTAARACLVRVDG